MPQHDPAITARVPGGTLSHNHCTRPSTRICEHTFSLKHAGRSGTRGAARRQILYRGLSGPNFVLRGRRVQRRSLMSTMTNAQFRRALLKPTVPSAAAAAAAGRDIQLSVIVGIAGSSGGEGAVAAWDEAARGAHIYWQGRLVAQIPLLTSQLAGCDMGSWNGGTPQILVLVEMDAAGAGASGGGRDARAGGLREEEWRRLETMLAEALARRHTRAARQGDSTRRLSESTIIRHEGNIDRRRRIFETASVVEVERDKNIYLSIYLSIDR